EHGVVLDGRGDEVRRLAAVEIRLQYTGQGEVVALRTARGEDNFFGLCVEQRGNGAARVLYGRTSALAGVMRGAGVAKALLPERTHGLDDLGKQRCRGVGVEVDALHTPILEPRIGACMSA